MKHALLLFGVLWGLISTMALFEPTSNHKLAIELLIISIFCILVAVILTVLKARTFHSTRRT